MTTSSREAADLTTKKEEQPSDGALSRANSTASWSRFKDPRIVRVSRASGGKDRHSKVCTVRGLRDRRVRLSVPTAIQLYDLQDRLGVNQPSKVVDWLLNAAKHDIDELPPLQMPLGNFVQGLHEPMIISPPQSEKLEGLKTSSLNWNDQLELSTSNYWTADKSKEIARETSPDRERNVELRYGGDHGGSFVSSSNFVSRNHHSSEQGNLLHNVIPNNSLLRWNASNLSLSQFGNHGLAPQPEEVLNFNIMPSSTSQLLAYPPQTQPYFPSQASSSEEFDPKQINFQMLSSSSSHNPLPDSLNPSVYSFNQAMRPNFQYLSMNPKFFHSQNHNENGPDKRN